jgi:hypothetical protein
VFFLSLLTFAVPKVEPIHGTTVVKAVKLPVPLLLLLVKPFSFMLATNPVPGAVVPVFGGLPVGMVADKAMPTIADKKPVVAEAPPISG